MNPVSFGILYVVIWWLVFFMALPVGIQQEYNPEKGHDKGAPKNPMIKIKMLITSFIALIITLFLLYLLDNDYFAFLNIRGN